MLHIKKRSPYQLATLYLFIMPFLLNFLQDSLYFPSVIKYTLDLAWLGILLSLLITRERLVYKKSLIFSLFIGIFLLYVLVTYLFSFQSPFYFLWGLRNNVRYYIAFIAFVYFLDSDDVQFCFKFIDILFVFHCLASFIQYFFLGYKWDYLGGIFGVELGCNGHSLILLVIVCTKSLVMYLNGKERGIICLLKSGVSLFIATIAELKFFFVIYLFVVVFAAITARFSARKVLTMVFSTVLLIIASNVFVAVWGQNTAFSFEKLMELITSENYSSTRDLGRFTAIPIISKTILKSVSAQCFGLGLGNCETSSFALFNTPFFQAHSYLNYDWFSSAFAFIETGYVGLALHISFFVLVFVCALRIKRKEEERKLYAEMSMCISLVCILLFFYNSSMRTDIGYLVYFMMALPFISTTPNSIHKSFLLEEKYG